jgi:ribonuclease toxin BrnT of type II toxin-antitoxin system
MGHECYGGGMKQHPLRTQTQEFMLHKLAEHTNVPLHLLPNHFQHHEYLDSAYYCAYNKTVKITWDSKKAATNPKHHDGVTFEEAQHVLFDPFALTREDSDSEQEQRFVTLGMGGKEKKKYG